MPLSLEQLKERPDILGRIDWELTPHEAFNAYQLRAKDNWKQRGLEETYYFYLSLWAGERRVLLIKRTYKQSEEVAEVEVPSELVEACAAQCDGSQMPTGQCPLDEPIKDWLRRELGQ